MIKSLEWRWMKGRDKDLCLPLVIFVPLDKGSGYYIHPIKDEILAEDGKYYPLDYGLVACSISANRISVDTTLAHEWRHHWQRFNKPPHFNPQFDKNFPYRSAILKFYKSSWAERDALRFSNKIAPCDVSREWQSWLI